MRPIVAWDRIGRVEKVSSMARRYGALAGINGSFFNRQRGQWYPVGYIMIDGKLIYKSDIHRPSFGITAQRELIIDYFKPRLFLRTKNGQRATIHFINRPAPSVGATLYTAHYGLFSGAPKEALTALLFRQDGEYKVAKLGKGIRSFSPDQRILTFSWKSQKLSKILRENQAVAIDEYIAPEFSNVVHLITGGPTLLKKSRIVRRYAEEGFRGFFLKPQPRSAIGITLQEEVLLVVVDGRQPGYSAGVTFERLSQIMKNFGAVEAMGLDSGGSSTLYAAGRILNRPSDGKERPVANGWFVFKDKYLY